MNQNSNQPAHKQFKRETKLRTGTQTSFWFGVIEGQNIFMAHIHIIQLEVAKRVNAWWQYSSETNYIGSIPSASITFFDSSKAESVLAQVLV